MRALSLFSGIGGLDVAVEHVFGADIVAHCESDPYCQQVLARHWPDVPCFDDIRELAAQDVGKVDLICGGFPCKDLSCAGKKAGFEGAHSSLWYEYLRLVRSLKPKYVAIENIPLLYRNEGYRAQVQKPLEKAGYRTAWALCAASDVGAPHKRERAFCLAVRNGTPWPEAGQGVRGRHTVQNSKRNEHSENTGALWQTLTARDWKTGSSTYSLLVPQTGGGPLNPEWLEAFMGLPAGWTEKKGKPLRVDILNPRWPAGKDEEQHPWEPPRSLPALGKGDNKKRLLFRKERTQALGNMVVPQQAALALWWLAQQDS